MHSMRRPVAAHQAEAAAEGPAAAAARAAAASALAAGEALWRAHTTSPLFSEVRP